MYFEENLPVPQAAEEPACTGARSSAVFPCVSGSSLGAAGLVAVVVRDALGRVLMGVAG